MANVTYYAAAGALLAALAVFLAFAPGATAARRALALLVGISASMTLTTAYATARPEPGAFGALADISLLGVLVTIGFFALYPRPAAPRSPHAALLVACAALVLASLATWLFARERLFAGPNPRLTLGWHWLGPYGEAVGIVGGLLTLSALSRLRGMPSHRGPLLVVCALALAVWLAPGAVLGAWAAATLGGGAYAPSALAPIPGDPLRLTAALWVAGWIVVPLAAIAYALLALRTRLPLVLAALGIALGAIGAFTPVAIAWSGAILTAALIPYAMTRHGALGGATAPRWAAGLLAATAGTGAFLVVNALLLGLAPENPLVLAVGILLGLVAGVAALAFTLPRALGALAALASTPDRTLARLDPYRALLVREREAGAPREALAEKLRMVRASLGVTDHEHDVLEYAIYGDSASRRGVAQGGVILGRYRVERTLREGGAGVTYLCADERLGRRVVLKALRGGGDDVLDAVMHEAQAMSRVRDAHVVTLLDVERVGNEAFLVMEHVEGGSLADRLAQGKLTPDELGRIGDDLLAGLDAVHAAGLVHRDVKPSNVLLTDAGRAKIADFGIAHLPGFETTAAANPGSASVAGTIRYMSPEHARGRRVDARSDLFSAAATLYEAWTGEAYLAPEPGESAVELQLRAASAGPFARAWNGPARMLPFWRRALDPRPAERFQSADEMRGALAKTMVGGG